MKQRITLIAEDGKILTDGTHYGRVVYLPYGDYGSSWHEIPEAEYNAIMAAKYAETQGGERNA